jgi:hypothetical protein
MLGSLPVAQFRRWHLEVWKAACGLDPLAFPLSRLSAAFDQVEVPSKWAQARGPIAGAMLELRRIGWCFGGPFEVHSDLGDAIILTRHSPAEVAASLGEACKRQLERSLAAKWDVGRGEGLAGAPRLAHEPIAKVLRSSRYPAKTKAVVKAFACNSFWTRQRLVTTGAGY